MIAWMLHITGLTKLGLYVAIAAAIIVVAGGYFGCTKIQNYFDQKQFETEVERQHDEAVKQGQKAVRDHTQYLLDSQKELSTEQRIKKDYYKKLQKALKEDAEFRKLHNKRKKYHLRQNKRLFE